MKKRKCQVDELRKRRQRARGDDAGALRRKCFDALGMDMDIQIKDTHNLIQKAGLSLVAFNKMNIGFPQNS